MTAVAETSPLNVRFYIPTEVVADLGLLDQYMRLVWPTKEQLWRRALSHGSAQPVSPWEWEAAPITEDLIAVTGRCEATPK
jgi:hypothetical protein